MEVEKTFTIPAKRFTQRLLRMLAIATGHLNARKLGRTRRGGWLVAGGSADLQPDGRWLVTVRMQKTPRPLEFLVPRVGGYSVKKLCPYAHMDIGKLLKDLTVAAAKA